MSNDTIQPVLRVIDGNRDDLLDEMEKATLIGVLEENPDELQRAYAIADRLASKGKIKLIDELP